MKFRKFLTIGIAALTVAAFSFGLAACKPDTEDPGKDPENPGGDTPVAPAEVTVEGGYGYYPPDQGGIGLELNLYEDGTYYYSQFTAVLYSGTYTAEEASGTDEDGNTILAIDRKIFWQGLQLLNARMLIIMGSPAARAVGIQGPISPTMPMRPINGMLTLLTWDIDDLDNEDHFSRTRNYLRQTLTPLVC